MCALRNNNHFGFYFQMPSSRVRATGNVRFLLIGPSSCQGLEKISFDKNFVVGEMAISSLDDPTTVEQFLVFASMISGSKFRACPHQTTTSFVSQDRLNHATFSVQARSSVWTAELGATDGREFSDRGEFCIVENGLILRNGGMFLLA